MTSLYEPLSFVLVRAPALPVDVYLSLSANERDEGSSASRLVASDQFVPRALATGSLSLARAVDRMRQGKCDHRAAANLRAKLLRYLIRMSTRPTPFGLFAGVALAKWGFKTDLRLSDQRVTRTRPDMAWLYGLVNDLESDLKIRRRLRFTANPAMVIRCGRIFLAERAPTGQNDASAVSIRATSAALRAIEMARRPTFHVHLYNELLATAAGATSEKVEKVLSELWKQTFLLSDLRPPLTADPAQYVLEKLGELADIPAASDARRRLRRLLERAEAFDRPVSDATSPLAAQGEADSTMSEGDSWPFQSDLRWQLHGQSISRRVADDAVRAVELLFRMSSSPWGAPHLAAYRGALVSRYGTDREVPILELLDPETGLGPPAPFGLGGNGSGLSQEVARRRRETLLQLACRALRDRQPIVELDEETLRRLETWKPLAAALPLSLDLYLSIIASSRLDVDSGHFLVVLGPNHGARAAGRNLGRFADLFEGGAIEALEEISRREREQAPQDVWAELAYLPRNLHSANVVVRPAVRDYEISVGVSPGAGPKQVIPANELLVGVRDERLYLRWRERPEQVRVCAGHMLNARQAPALCRFLSEIEQDGVAQFLPFDWGPAAAFPFLPRVQVGRVVLRLAQWRVDSKAWAQGDFHRAFRRWRDAWEVPQYVYAGMADNRLLLDLEDAGQAELLRAEIVRLTRHGAGGEITVQEALPRPQDAWLEGPGGAYVHELVVSLIRRARQPASRSRLVAQQTQVADRLRLPGSEWLFVKLYSSRGLDDDFIGGPLRGFASAALRRGLANDWFYIRYADPDHHLRVRFKGAPIRLMGELLPALAAWAGRLVADGFCRHWSVDTYERELERYGGETGLGIAEEIFCADSRATADLLALSTRGLTRLDRIALALLSLDDLFGSFELAEGERMDWFRKNTKSRAAGALYRERKDEFRSLISEPQLSGSEVMRVLKARREAISPLAHKLRALAERFELSQAPEMIYRSHLHLHCNRLLGNDHGTERHVMELLRRTREGLFRKPVTSALTETTPRGA